jgi:hypothetical protein
MKQIIVNIMAQPEQLAPGSAVGSRAKSVNLRVCCRLEIDTPRAIICNCPGSNKERT